MNILVAITDGDFLQIYVGLNKTQAIAKFLKKYPKYKEDYLDGMFDIKIYKNEFKVDLKYSDYCKEYYISLK